MMRRPFSVSVYMSDEERECLNDFFRRYSSLRRSDVLRNYLLGMIGLYKAGRPCFLTKDGDMLNMSGFASYIFEKDGVDE